MAMELGAAPALANSAECRNGIFPNRVAVGATVL